MAGRLSENQVMPGGDLLIRSKVSPLKTSPDIVFLLKMALLVYSYTALLKVLNAFILFSPLNIVFQLCIICHVKHDYQSFGKLLTCIASRKFS